MRKSALVAAMSAIPPIATELRTSLVVRFVPLADIALLLDHFVGAGEKHGRNGEAECLGGPEINHQLILRRRLHQQVRWLLAAEDAIDIAGRASVHVDRIGPVGYQAAGGGEVAVRVDCRQSGNLCRAASITINSPTYSRSRSCPHLRSARMQ